MGKLTYVLILIFAIELSMILFLGTEIPGTSLYSFLTSPSQWDDNNLINSMINDVLLIGGAATVVAGLYFIRNEWIIYAGISAVFFSFGQTLYQFWQYVSSQGLWGDSGIWVATIFLGGLMISFIITVLDFSRGKD